MLNDLHSEVPLDIIKVFDFLFMFSKHVYLPIPTKALQSLKSMPEIVPKVRE